MVYVQSDHTKYQFVQRDGHWDSSNMLVDPNQGEKAQEINLLSFERPHMMAFHMSWMSSFVAFVCWFAFAPLMSTVGTEFGMSPEQVYAVGIASVARGDRLKICTDGALRQVWTRAVPVFFCWRGSRSSCSNVSPLVNGVYSLALVRCAIGFGGATCVMTQYWPRQMFISELADMATFSGWGHMGGGVTQILMGCLFTTFSKVFPASYAWRMSMIVPGCLSAMMCAFLFFFSDDMPLGDYHQLYAHGVLERHSFKDSARAGFANPNSWILGMQYGAESLKEKRKRKKTRGEKVISSKYFGDVGTRVASASSSTSTTTWPITSPVLILSRAACSARPPSPPCSG